MKLYLSSYMLGDHSHKLLEMAGGSGARMAIITNALDAIPLEAQLDYARNKSDVLIYCLENGFDPSFIDLRRYFGRPDDLALILGRYSVIFAVGGNSFLLRRAMRDSGFDTIITGLLKRGIVYAGWSAGACVAGDRLEAIALMDEPDAKAPGYLTTDVLETGLGLIPKTIIPHYESDHPEGPAALEAVSWARSRGIEHIALRDGEVIVLENQRLEVLPALIR